MKLECLEDEESTNVTFIKLVAKIFS
jgi:hypothetical protein